MLGNLSNASNTLDEAAELIRDNVRNIAKGKGLYVTGAGWEGIEKEGSGDEKRDIGWMSRPNLHLRFHEVGTYKDYPRPHMRPGAEQSREPVKRLMQDKLIGL